MSQTAVRKPKGSKSRKDRGAKTAPVKTDGTEIEQKEQESSGTGITSLEAAAGATLNLSPVPQVVNGPPKLPPPDHTPQVVNAAPTRDHFQ